MASHPEPLNISPRAARTRAAMIAAGFELLVERPIDAIAIDEVVARAGVAKGSFFNHFPDKQVFAEAIASEVRVELEALVTRVNADVTDPVKRIAGGMRVAADFALNNPKRTAVLLRSHASSTARDHPLNQGLVHDFRAAVDAGLVRPEAEGSGVLYWLGLCQILMANLVEKRLERADADRRISDMMILGLSGLGVDSECASKLARKFLTTDT